MTKKSHDLSKLQNQLNSLAVKTELDLILDRQMLGSITNFNFNLSKKYDSNDCPWIDKALSKNLLSYATYNNSIPFTIGLFNTQNLLDLENFIKNNKANINACYVYPLVDIPLDFSWLDIKLNYDNQTIKNLEQQIEVYKKYNIPIQVAFNFLSIYYTFTNQQIINHIANYINLFGVPDYIITFDKFAQVIKEKYPDIKLVRTAKEPTVLTENNNNIQFFDTLCFKNNFYNFDLLNTISYDYAKKVEFLLDTTCITQCPNNEELCFLTFKKLIENSSMVDEIASQIILPTEFDLYKNVVNSIRFSPNALSNLQAVFYKYSMGLWSNYNIIADYLMNFYTKYSSNSNTEQLIKNIDFKLDLETYHKIIEFKNKKWSEFLKKPIQIEFTI